jgi:uncharacterized protein (DUF362 family)
LGAIVGEVRQIAPWHFNLDVRGKSVLCELRADVFAIRKPNFILGDAILCMEGN